MISISNSDILIISLYSLEFLYSLEWVARDSNPELVGWSRKFIV